MTKHRLSRIRAVSILTRIARFSVKSQLLTVWLALCALGFFMGLRVRPDPGAVPFEELFENMSVHSYRDAPSDSTARFVVELSARGRVFRQYDIDAQRFTPPVRGYRRSITGTRYPALRVRGHVDRGFWLELPDSSRSSLLPDQFEELYRTTLDFVRPISIVTNALATLSGYSIGYRIATWGSSLSSAAVQERVLATPGFGRAIAREAWRRVLLEPVVMAEESDAGRFASLRGTHRVYTNFFRLAINDTNGFIPSEVARLDSAGNRPESGAMLAFTRAVRCASEDSCHLASADFAAVETWASMLDRHGHWAYRATPPRAAERMQYFGTLAWYGLAPAATDERRFWVGPRMLVRVGDAEGFVADEIPSIPAGRPTAWHGWLRGDASHPSGNAWTAQWMAESRQLAPAVDLCLRVARALGGGGNPVPVEDHPAVAGEAAPIPHAVATAPGRAAHDSVSQEPSRVALAGPGTTDTTHTADRIAQAADSTWSARFPGVDSIVSDPDGRDTDLRTIRATLGGFGR